MNENLSVEFIQSKAGESQKYLNNHVIREGAREFGLRAEQTLSELNGLLRNSYFGEDVACAGNLIKSSSQVSEGKPVTIMPQLSVEYDSKEGKASHFIAIDLDDNLFFHPKVERGLLSKIRRESGRIAICHTVNLKAAQLGANFNLSTISVQDSVAAPISSSYLFVPERLNEYNSQLGERFIHYASDFTPKDVEHYQEILGEILDADNVVEGIIGCSRALEKLLYKKTELQIRIIIDAFQKSVHAGLQNSIIGFVDLPPVYHLHSPTWVTPVKIDTNSVMLSFDGLVLYPKYATPKDKGTTQIRQDDYGLFMTGVVENKSVITAQKIAIPMANLTSKNVAWIRQ